MIKSKEEMTNRGVEIDLTGPDGNAMCLMSHAKRFARQTGKDGNAIVAEMMSGDYDNVVDVFEREFGSVVTLYR